MFPTWCVLKGLGSKRHTRNQAALRSRRVTPGRYLIEACDGKLTDEDLSDTGNAFARDYYDGDILSRSFSAEYAAAFEDDQQYPSVYHVEDSWETYDILAGFLRASYEDWQACAPQRMSRAERFQCLCQELGQKLEPFGYRFSKSGPHVSKRSEGFCFQIAFSERDHSRLAALRLKVGSNRLNAWRKSHGVTNPTNTVIMGSPGSILGIDVPELWDVTKPQIADSMFDLIQSEIEPFLKRFLDGETMISDAVALNYPGWDPMNRIHYLLCFGSHAQARQAAINWFQGNIGIYYPYKSHFQTYKDHGLVRIEDGGLAQWLAHTSHVLGFGDLSLEVTPE